MYFLAKNIFLFLFNPFFIFVRSRRRNKQQRSFPMKRNTVGALLAAGALTFTFAACGDDNNNTGSSQAPAPAPATQQADPVAKIDNLTGKTTAVALDENFVKALGTLKLTPGVLGDAELTKGGSLVFPITGGNVTYYKPGTVSPYVQGEIDHDGSGFSLTGGGKTVELSDFVIDPGASVLTGKVTVDGQVAADSAPLFFLDGRTLKPLQANDDGTAVLEGTTVKLKDEAAQLLNETFGTDALEGGLVIGIAKITVNT
jgi:hypothetical protein